MSEWSKITLGTWKWCKKEGEKIRRYERKKVGRKVTKKEKKAENRVGRETEETKKERKRKYIR